MARSTGPSQHLEEEEVSLKMSLLTSDSYSDLLKWSPMEEPEVEQVAILLLELLDRNNFFQTGSI